MEELYRATFDQVRAPEALRQRVGVPPRSRRVPVRRWLPAAICACLLLLCAACTAQKLLSARLSSMTYGPGWPAYTASGSLRPVPEESLSPEVREALAESWRAWQDWQTLPPEDRPELSPRPGNGGAAFDTWAQGGQYLGLTPDNLLEEIPWLEHAASRYNDASPHCSLSWAGGQDGHITHTCLYAGYQTGDIYIQLSVLLITEYNEAGADGYTDFYTVVWPESTAFTTETYPLADGQEASLLTAQPEDTTFSVSVYACFVRDGLLYSIETHAPNEDGAADAAREAAIKVLELF